MQGDNGQDRATRDAVERSWAVAALEQQLRLRARTAATLAWDRLAEPHRTRSTGRLLTRPEIADIELVAQAYERAGLERIETLRREGAGASHRMRQELRVAAAELFEHLRVLPLPQPMNPDGFMHAMRIAAIAVVADRQSELAVWTRATGLELAHGEWTTDEGWDAQLRAAVALTWLDLLSGPTPDAVERAFDRLGTLRELRPLRENELLAVLPLAGAQHMRLHLIALYGLAEAAAALVLHLRRGPHPRVFAQLAKHLDGVLATTTGDTAFDRLVPWLHAGAETIAARQSAQIPLPGLLA